MSQRNRNILILAGDADGNLGDRAILAAMCEAIRGAEPQCKITVVSRNPQAISESLGVASTSRGLRGMPALCAAALRSRLILIGGGGLFQDDDSLIKMPYWAARCALMRLLCPNIVACSLGVGPLRSMSSRLSGMLSFAVMRRISVRDHYAKTTAQPLTSKPVTVVPDPAFMLPPLENAQGEKFLRDQNIPTDDGLLIGVTVRRWFPAKARWIPNMVAAKFRDTTKQDEQSEQLIRLYAKALDDAITQTGGRVVMMPTYNVAHEGDDRLCEQIRQTMSSNRSHLIRINDPAMYKSVAQHLAVMVGGRMHPTIFAASVGTPVVGIAYNPKFSGVFKLLGVEHRVIAVNDFVNNQLSEALTQAIVSAIKHDLDLLPRAKHLSKKTHEWIASVLKEVMR